MEKERVRVMEQDVYANTFLCKRLSKSLSYLIVSQDEGQKEEGKLKILELLQT